MARPKVSSKVFAPACMDVRRVSSATVTVSALTAFLAPCKTSLSIFKYVAHFHKIL